MSPHARARLQYVHARMAVGQSNNLPDIKSQFFANERQLVGKGNIDIPEGIFRQLDHFCRARISALHIAADKTAVKRYPLSG